MWRKRGLFWVPSTAWIRVFFVIETDFRNKSKMDHENNDKLYNVLSCRGCRSLEVHPQRKSCFWTCTVCQLRQKCPSLWVSRIVTVGQIYSSLQQKSKMSANAWIDRHTRTKFWASRSIVQKFLFFSGFLLLFFIFYSLLSFSSFLHDSRPHILRIFDISIFVELTMWCSK